MQVRTDLAEEAQALWRQSAGEDHPIGGGQGPVLGGAWRWAPSGSDF